MFCLSLPPGWRIREDDLVGKSPKGRDHLRSVVRELEAAGYVKRSQTRLPNGFVGPADWEVWDQPQTENPSTDDPLPENPLTGKPSTENPSTDKTRFSTGKSPSTENPSTDVLYHPTVDGLSVDGKPDSIERKHINPLGSLEVSKKASRLKSLSQSITVETSADDQPAPRLPACAEPFRDLVVAWYRKRALRHPGAPVGLSERSVGAIHAADAAGLLQPFLEAAAGDGRKCLGYRYRQELAKLAAGPIAADGFDTFKTSYLAVKRRASGQSIPAALNAYSAALNSGITPQQLLSALHREIQQQQRSEQQNGWAPCLPDIARWLRDRRFEAYLEINIPQKAKRPLVHSTTPLDQIPDPF